MNKATDYTNIYFLGIEQIKSGFYKAGQGTIELLELEKRYAPQNTEVLNKYIGQLEQKINEAKK